VNWCISIIQNPLVQPLSHLRQVGFREAAGLLDDVGQLRDARGLAAAAERLR
jgi:hypothetical protein